MSGRMRFFLPAAFLALWACSDSGPEEVLTLEQVGTSQFQAAPLDTIPDTLTVRVLDGRSRPVAGVTVTWSADVSGSVTPVSSTTDAAGEARATWVLGWEAGFQQVTAIAEWATDSVVFQATAAGFQAIGLSTGDGGQTCGIAPGGQLYCWGWNVYGQLGDGTMLDSRIPVKAGLNAPVKQAVTTDRATCALTTDGATVWCWGDNTFGELGNGTTTSSLAPVQVNLPAGTYIALSGVSYGRCALRDDGQAYCWGSNLRGRFGTGNNTPVVSTPELVLGGFPWRQVAIGHGKSCGIRVGGQVYCWGEHPEWLGTGVDTNTVEPLPVLQAPLMDSVAVGQWHQCGLVSLVVHCWGANFNIGVPDPRNVFDAPVAIPMQTSIRSIMNPWAATFVLGSHGAGYWWGPPDNASGGGPFSPTLFTGAIRLSRLGGNVCGTELTTSTVFCWENFSWNGPATVRALPVP